MNWKMVHAFGRAKRYLWPRYLVKEVRRGFSRYAKDQGLTNINLSFTNRCSVDCIFCPEKRGRNSRVSFMDKACLEKILDEAASRPFQKHHNIQIVSVGENGDAFLHRDCLDFLRLIRRRLPSVKVQVYTNFRLFTPDKADVVLKERLLDFIGCNIDGADEHSYHSVKRGDFKTVKANFLYFIAHRRRLWRDIPVHIPVLTFHDYVKGIYQHLGVWPQKLKNETIDIAHLNDDFEAVVRAFKNVLDHPKDKLYRTVPLGWAERRQVSPPEHEKGFTCPVLTRLEKEAFIAPDGRWYLCCWDGETELIVGDTAVSSLHDIYHGTKRSSLLHALKQKDFRRIGGPCATIQCCQKMPPHTA